MYSTQAEYKELRDTLYRLHQGGQYPVVLIPMDTEVDVVLAVPAQDVEVRRDFLAVWSADMVFEELPHPIVGL